MISLKGKTIEILKSTCLGLGGGSEHEDVENGIFSPVKQFCVVYVWVYDIHLSKLRNAQHKK